MAYTKALYEIVGECRKSKNVKIKAQILKDHESTQLIDMLQLTYNPSIQWLLPEGNPPYIKNEAPAGTEHSSLAQEARKLYHFIVGGNNQITKLKKETMFIQMLEGLHEKDAEVLMAIKNKNLNNIYKGLTSQMVKETFGWNDDFVRIAQ